MAKLIAISGGIGSGKSIVSEILQANGFDVYDCDREAKRIMDNDTNIHDLLRLHIHPDAVKNGLIDRNLIASIVFNDKDRLNSLNHIVHQAVRDDITRYRLTLSNDTVMFIETAILYQSNIDLMVDEVWEVTAPREIRIQRVMLRNNCTVTEVEARINAQDEYSSPRTHPLKHIIVNDNIQPVLPQVIKLLNRVTGS